MRRLLFNRRGFAMAFNTALIAFVAVPLLTFTTEITRALYVNVKIQTAIDAACTAGVQAVDVPLFISTGQLVIDPDQSISYAQREFNATVISSNIQRYSPVLTSLNIINDSRLQCNGSATMDWFLPGVPPLSIAVTSGAEAMARR